MPPMDEFSQGMDILAAAWMEYRPRLLRLVTLRMSNELGRRMGADDLMQDAYLHCCRNADFFAKRPDVPVYAKLRMMVLQAMAAASRVVLATGRDVRKEVSMEASLGDWTAFADALTGPVTNIMREERCRMVRRVLDMLSDSDREIISMRNLEDLSNNECSAILQISPAAASVRYMRALKRMTDLLVSISIG